jgi:hypothetical protein
MSSAGDVSGVWKRYVRDGHVRSGDSETLLIVQPECPLCRQALRMERLVAAYNL